MNYSPLILFLTSLVNFARSELEAILTNSRLPFRTGYADSIYDGDDSIFIFGGRSEFNVVNSIHQYQISTDTLFPSIASLTSDRHAGRVSSDSSGNIFYYGGGLTVLKFNPNNFHVDEVAELQDFGYASVVIKPDAPEIAFLIGGQESTPDVQHVRCFNMSSATFCGQTELQDSASLVYNIGFVHGENAFVIPYSPESRILILDLKSLHSVVMETTLPSFRAGPSVVTDGNCGYIVGGWYNSSLTPMDSLIKFDPETLQHEFIRVKNHPGEENSRVFLATSTVYVKKLNRIYIIGGTDELTSDEYTYHYGIWYIDLTPPTAPTTPISTSSTPTPTSTTPKPDGNCTEDGIYFVPYPEDCSKYMVCFHYDLLPDVQTCPPNTLFDPVLGECNAEDLVSCEPLCPNNSSLIYIPHRNCSLYWLCVWGEIELRTCPENMVFDPQMNNCNYNEFVFCPNLCPTDTPIANFPHESDCSKYWHCVNGNPSLISCPDGQLYDPDLGQCSRDAVECDKRF